MEEHKRKYDRLRSERKIRMHKKRQAQSTAAAPPPSASSFMPENGAFQMPGNPMDILTELMQDPTLMASMQVGGNRCKRFLFLFFFGCCSFSGSGSYGSYK